MAYYSPCFSSNPCGCKRGCEQQDCACVPKDGTAGQHLVLDASGKPIWVNDSGGGTDSQTLSLSGNELSISNGNTVTLPSGGTDEDQLIEFQGGHSAPTSIALRDPVTNVSSSIQVAGSVLIFGDGATTEFPIAHNLNSDTVQVQVFELDRTNNTYKLIQPDVTIVDDNNITIGFTPAPSGETTDPNTGVQIPPQEFKVVIQAI